MNYKPRLGELRAFKYKELTNPETCPPDIEFIKTNMMAWAVFQGRRYLVGRGYVFTIDSDGRARCFSEDEFDTFYKKVD